MNASIAPAVAPVATVVPPRPLGRADWTDLLALAPKAEAGAVRALDLARRAAVEARVGEGGPLLARLVDADDRVVLAFVEATRRKEPASAGATRAVKEAARVLWGLALEALRAKEAEALQALRTVTGLGEDATIYFLRRKAEARGFLEESEAAAWAASALRRAEVLAARKVEGEVATLRIPLSGANEWILPAVPDCDPDAVEDALEFEMRHGQGGLLRRMAREVYLQWEAAGLPLVEVELVTEGFEDCDGDDWDWVSGLRLTVYSLKTGDIVAEAVERF